MTKILKYITNFKFFIMERFTGTNKSPESAYSTRRTIAGLLAMTPFFLACEKNADTTTLVDIPTSAPPIATVSIKPAISTKPAESTEQPPIKPEVKISKPEKKDIPLADEDRKGKAKKNDENVKRESHVTLKGNPSKIGPTVLLGDSLTAKVGEFGGKFNIEDTMVVAKVGEKTSWLLGQAQELGRSGKLGRFENAVVLIGSNDMGDERPAFTAPKIFGRIEKIYSTLLGDSNFDGKPNFKGVDRVYGVTIPPFKGENALSKDEEIFSEINNKRLEINRLIKGSKLTSGVFDIAATHSQGGLADDDDPGRLSIIGPNGKKYETSDGLHFPKKWLRLIYERELRKSAK